ncbi:MAG: hypothetical protein KBD78_09310 [Oligoflexales bacterium]|nr:hypothetical protein [Oligoflexales bacterium]
MKYVSTRNSVILLACLLVKVTNCAESPANKGHLQDRQNPASAVQNIETHEEKEESATNIGTMSLNEANDLIVHDRPCDGAPKEACIFQARTFMESSNKKYEIIVAKDKFYIYQILDGANNKKFYYKDYEKGYGQKVSDLFVRNMTPDNLICNNCSIDTLDSYRQQDGSAVLSVTRKNFYENYKFDKTTKKWREWAKGGTLTSVLGRYVKGSDTSISSTKFPCDVTKPAECAFKTRSSFISGMSIVDSVSTFSKYYNIEKKGAGNYVIWNSNGRFLGSVDRYKVGVCANTVESQCSFDTRTFNTENNVVYESITAKGKYFNYYKDSNGNEKFFVGSLDSVPRYKTKPNGESKIAKHGMTGGSCIDSRKMDGNWAYNWGGKQDLSISECAGLEFVGMHWGPTVGVSNPGVKNQSTTPGSVWKYNEVTKLNLYFGVKTTLIPSQQKSKDLFLTHYPFSLDKLTDNAKITGVKVIMKRKNNNPELGSIKDLEIKLIKKNLLSNTLVFSSNRASNMEWPSSVADITYGSLEDLWGFSSISVAELKDISFGLKISIQTPQNGNNVEAQIDYIALRIYYLPSVSDVEQFSESKYFLGFNEPNGKNQANMTPEEAAIMWKILEDLFKGKYSLIAPVPSQKEGDPNFDQGVEWLKSFRNVYIQKYGTAPQLHALAVHCYLFPKYDNKPYDTSYCKNLIQQYINLSKTWKLPGSVWLTEFAVSYDPGVYDTYASLYGNQSVEYLKDGIKDMLAWVSTNEDVGRYAWFTNRRRRECLESGPFHNCPSMPLYLSRIDNIYGLPANYVGEIYRNFGEQ